MEIASCVAASRYQKLPRLVFFLPLLFVLLLLLLLIAQPLTPKVTLTQNDLKHRVDGGLADYLRLCEVQFMDVHFNVCP
jgi:hypothetical protein